jgi:hypothetical protein
MQRPFVVFWTGESTGRGFVANRDIRRRRLRAGFGGLRSPRWSARQSRAGGQLAERLLYGELRRRRALPEERECSGVRSQRRRHRHWPRNPVETRAVAGRQAACSAAQQAGGGLMSRNPARLAGAVEISPWRGLIFRKHARASGFPHISPRSRRFRGGGRSVIGGARTGRRSVIGGARTGRRSVSGPARERAAVRDRPGARTGRWSVSGPRGVGRPSVMGPERRRSAAGEALHQPHIHTIMAARGPRARFRSEQRAQHRSTERALLAAPPPTVRRTPVSRRARLASRGRARPR